MTKTLTTREDILADIAARAGARAGGPVFRERAFRHAAERTPEPAAAKSNGGPRIYDSPIEEFKDIGNTLYPTEAWIPRLAKDIGEHPRQIRRWVNGEAVISDIALKRARMAIREQIRRLEGLLVRIGEGTE